eukprot:8622889-Alexandrium_andersonii.AAC.1
MVHPPASPRAPAPLHTPSGLLKYCQAAPSPQGAAVGCKGCDPAAALLLVAPGIASPSGGVAVLAARR